jgi:hypothetical protein
MTIDMPIEFRNVCRNLGQDIVAIIRSMNEDAATKVLVNTALIGLGKNEAAVVSEFLEDLLSRTSEPGALTAFWWSTPAEIHFYEDGAVKRFLQALNSRLSQPPFERNVV